MGEGIGMKNMGIGNIGRGSSYNRGVRTPLPAMMYIHTLIWMYYYFISSTICMAHGLNLFLEYFSKQTFLFPHSLLV